jgi:hypothetical protein
MFSRFAVLAATAISRRYQKVQLRSWIRDKTRARCAKTSRLRAKSLMK